MAKQYQSHLNGKVSKNTRSFKPIKMAQYWQVTNKSMAMQLENRIKKLSRQNKEKIIAKPDLLYSFIKAKNNEYIT